MRLVLFTDTLADVNGVSRFIRTAAEQAAATGRELTVITSTRMKGVPVASNVKNIDPWYARAMPRYPQLEVAFPPRGKLFAAADACRPTAVHVSTPGPFGAAGRAYALKRGLPLMGTYHTDFPAYIDHLVGIEALTTACSDLMAWFYEPFRMVFTRSAEYAAGLRRIGVGSERVERLLPGIDLAAFTAQGSREDGRAVWREHAGVRAGSVKCLFAGRVSVEKNQPLLVEVWPEIARRAKMAGVDAQLIIVGDGPYRATMQRELEKSAPGGAVFLGFRHGKELARIYGGCDLFLFPSRTDTLGQVVMESQASGMAVIVTPDGGPREVVREGKTGLVVKAEARAWVEASVALIVDHARREAMGRAAAEYMSGFTFAASFEAFWGAQERVVEGAGAL